MNKPFKFRYVNEIAGGFVLLAMLCVVVGIVVAGHAQGWFEPEIVIYSAFSDEGAFGVQEGAPVEILGTVAGSVRRIDLSPTGGMRAELRVRERFMTYVRSDSEVLVKTRFGIGGDVFVEITRGRGDKLEGDNITLPARKDKALIETIEKQVDALQAEIMPILNNVNALLVEYTGLAADLRNPTNSLQEILGSLNGILAKVAAGEGSAGKLLNDPAAANEIIGALEGANRSVAELEGALKHVREATERLPGMTDSLSVSLAHVPTLLDETERTLGETRRLLEGVQRHWLLRKYVEPKDALPATVLPSVLDGGRGGAR